MSAHGVVASGTQHFFHARTRIASSRALQNGLSGAKPAVAQRMQVDTRYQQIAAQRVSAQFDFTENPRHRIEVFSLDQCHLTLAIILRLIVVARETEPGNRLDLRL